jgi:hypothetical protein
MAAADGARRSRVPAGEAFRGGLLRGTAQRPRPLQGSQPRQSRRRPQGACQRNCGEKENVTALFPCDSNEFFFSSSAPPPKVVENPVITVQTFDGPAQSAIQYFENMRNFLVAVSAMNLLTFETSDIEKVNS